jgi:aspartate ammonia-lyase
MKQHRTERDTLGEVRVPAKALWGAQTQRAIENFPISGRKAFPNFIWASSAIKCSAAQVHKDLNLLPPQKADAIIQASQEIMAGKWHNQFVVDVYQAGAGTSHNMNTNEVIANRALQILGYDLGRFDIIHPNNDVNMGQSTNDVFPTAMRLFFLKESIDLLRTLYDLETGFKIKAQEFDTVIKSGRTHLQDAVPIRLGQEFNAYGEAIKKCRLKIGEARKGLEEIGLGGSAVGTGLNVHPEYRAKIAVALKDITNLEVRPAQDYFWAMQSMEPFLEFSGSINNLAIEISRICNDIRLLASGPNTGLYEIVLPPVQPGSSIMPGKVNPVMAEMLNMVCFSVIGYHQAVMWASGAGQLELNVMMPVIAFSIGESIMILNNGLKAFRERGLNGLKANPEVCRAFMEKSLGLATVLNTFIGYEKAGEVAKIAQRSNRSIKDVILTEGILSPEELEEILDPVKLTQPGIPKKDQDEL